MPRKNAVVNYCKKSYKGVQSLVNLSLVGAQPCLSVIIFPEWSLHPVMAVRARSGRPGRAWGRGEGAHGVAPCFLAAAKGFERHVHHRISGGSGAHGSFAHGLRHDISNKRPCMNDKIQMNLSRPLLETALGEREEGELMTLGPHGLELVLVRKNVEEGLHRAFCSGISKYSYWESFTPVPIPVWVFFFTPPLEAFDVLMNPALVKREAIHAFLEAPHGDCGRLRVFLVQRWEPREKLDLMLDERVIPPFKRTLEKHLRSAFDFQEFLRSVETVRRFNVSALWRFGMPFAGPGGKGC